ncbi:DUF1680-domain-containing protein [Cryphonectria parasitica EP155]|uniref:DUF1680-domain-containing protein n=1 Tax=Cryphonectria parasitica (strain ATCC 38755 / EP155) TaxID=660469 RepID=A0A9P4XTC1_CRYP1|nr:DUF1680-domain-containing protein [Cryphonectria parasitica EP155]KAF3760543.1 DUF1680-domain-containing protein [Cryphonectria parasitica EP155]
MRITLQPSPSPPPPNPSSQSLIRFDPQGTFTHTTFTSTASSSLLATRRQTIFRTTLLAQLDLLKTTGRYDCFELKWKPIYDDHRFWPVPPHLFWDSDLGKWMEGAIYFLREQYDRDLDEAVRYLVRTMRSAQQEDGYLNLHYIVVEPGKRWTNLRDMHEMYNAGHLLEAAIAHHDHYKTNEFLNVMTRYVHLMHAHFGPGQDQRRGYPGHPELELALLRLYRTTGDVKAYELARFFLTERGKPGSQQNEAQQQQQHYYDWEADQRGEEAHKRPNSYPMARDYWYCQAHVPIPEQQSIEGHAVRATYLLTATADLLALAQQQQQQQQQHPPHNLSLPDPASWESALHRLWNNMIQRKMYPTGGIGAAAQWEGFGIDYFLPQSPDEGGCYAETCASVGAIMLAERLLHLNGPASPDAHIADVMELCLYNTVLGSVSLDGRGFTYENYLASCEGHLCRREGWFECSCCPPNVSRLFGSLGGYLWHFEEEKKGVFINVHLYTSAKLEFIPSSSSSSSSSSSPVQLEQKTNWPWENNIMFTLHPPAQEPPPITIRLRIPSWSQGRYLLTPSPSPAEPATLSERGYLVLSPAYLRANPSFSLLLGGFEPRFVRPHPRNTSCQRTLALARGPLVYCVEDVDNPWEENHFKDIVVDDKAAVWVEGWKKECLGDEYVALRAKGWTRRVEGWDVMGSAPSEEERGEERELVFVPYYLRANRGGKGHMRVGLLRP